MSSIAPSWPKRYALVDCNSFYASCERLFRPNLRGKPLIVLSNNDGCVISMSIEAKEMGIRTGSPYHLSKDLIRKHKIEVFSSNYQLYGDISRRVMKTLETMTPELSMYSIDEAFMDFSHVPPGEEVEYARQVSRRVWKEVGIPVTVGVGLTKVLSKVANRAAKKKKIRAMSLIHPQEIDDCLASFPVADIWGVGHNSALKLKSVGIQTAKDFRDYDNTARIRSMLTVVGERLRDELRGIDCVEQTELAQKKMIASTRSFGRRVYDRRELEEAVSTYVSFACEKLRGQGSVAQGIMVSLQTSRFDEEDARFRDTLQAQLDIPSADTGLFTRTAIDLVRQIYRPGIGFKKAGVFLFDIGSNQGVQTSFFSQAEPQRDDLMSVMDNINKRYGRSTVKMASCGTQQDWRMLCEHRSKKTQLEWSDLVEVGREKTTEVVQRR